MSHPLVQIIEKAYMKPSTPEFHVGDTVDVLTRIVEGDKERSQTFNGLVIGRKGRGMNAMFTVRRTVGNEGVERTFMLHSPRVVDVTVKRRGKVRRAKLYFLRQRVGKARKLRELRVSRTKVATASPAPAPQEEASPAVSASSRRAEAVGV